MHKFIVNFNVIRNFQQRIELTIYSYEVNSLYLILLFYIK